MNQLPTRPFMTAYLHTERGWITPNTGMCGHRVWMEISGLMIPMGTGHTLMMVGRGLLIMHGVGRRFIMEGGSTMITMVGCGFPATIGLPHGLPGVMLAMIIAGRL